MTIKQILNLDCREKIGQEKLQKALRLIKPLSRFSMDKDVPMVKVEKVITVLSKKYNMHIREFTADVWANEDETIWRATLIDDNTLGIIGCAYGISVYEVFAKVAILMYANRNSVQTRTEGKT